MRNLRALFPFTASIVDQARACFGPDVTVIYAYEGGKFYGTEPDRSREAVVSAGNGVPPPSPVSLLAARRLRRRRKL